MVAPQTPTRRHRARRGEGDRLREEIVAAATRLLIEKGAEEAVSIRAIADAVGVTPPSIYLHFTDKDDLFLAVCDDRFQELDRRSETAAAGAVDEFDEIRRRGEAYIRFGLENPEQYRILFMGMQHNATSEQVTEWAALQHMIGAVQRCMDAGLMEVADPFLVTIGLWAQVHGLTSLLISMPDFPWPPVEELIDHLLGSCAFGLVRRDETGRPAEHAQQPQPPAAQPRGR